MMIDSQKIYTRVVIDMESLETVSEESCMYTGEVAECKGGGSSGVDKAYNSRMAAIAEMAMQKSELSEYERKYGFRPGDFQSDFDKRLYARTSDGTAYINKDAYTKPEDAASATAEASAPVTSAKYMKQQIDVANTPNGIHEWYKIEDDPNWAGGA